MKRLQLRPRLKAIAHMIAPCNCMADIGTDHGYLPVWLCLEDRCKTAIAADINPSPLARAEETVRRFGMLDRISLRLGGGAEPLSPGEADTIVIAGMGGLLIGEILKADPEVFGQAKQILLQPMSSIPELREQLYSMGYSIQNESLVPEEEKLYHILSVEKIPEVEEFAPIDFVLGRQLCKTQPEHFPRYLAAQKERFSRKLAGMQAGKASDTRAMEKTKEILHRIEELLL